MNRTAGKQLEVCLGEDDEQGDILCIRIKGQTNKDDTAVSVCYRLSDEEEEVDGLFTGSFVASHSQSWFL